MSCDGCRRPKPIQKFRTTLHFSASLLFDTLSIDSAEPSPFPRTKFGNRYIFIAVEHLRGWRIAIAPIQATGNVIMSFMEWKEIYPVSPRRTVVSDNANCFPALTLMEVMKQFWIKWKPVLAYAPGPNGRGERMVGMWKWATGEMVTSKALSWNRPPKIPLRKLGGKRKARSLTFWPHVPAFTKN